MSFLVQQFSVVSRLEQNGSSFFNNKKKEPRQASSFYICFFFVLSLSHCLFFFCSNGVCSCNVEYSYRISRKRERKGQTRTSLSRVFQLLTFSFPLAFSFCFIIISKGEKMADERMAKKVFFDRALHVLFFFFLLSVCLFASIVFAHIFRFCFRCSKVTRLCFFFFFFFFYRFALLSAM